MIKTKTGLGDEYLKQITQTVKPVYDEEKKQKIILDYKILNGEASGPQDFNIMILVNILTGPHSIICGTKWILSSRKSWAPRSNASPQL